MWIDPSVDLLFSDMSVTFDKAIQDGWAHMGGCIHRCVWATVPRECSRCTISLGHLRDQPVSIIHRSSVIKKSSQHIDTRHILSQRIFIFPYPSTKEKSSLATQDYNRGGRENVLLVRICWNIMSINTSNLNT